MTAVGEVIGNYTITGKIGEGGMGAVFVGEHELLGRRAAVKVLLKEFSRNPEIVARFFNEARATTTIEHPGIVQVFDFGHHTDGSAYLVMELLSGESLDKRIERLGRLPANDVMRIIRQAAGALEAAHQLSIVHRDLKPENLFLVPDADVPGGERVKILDFGIAKLTGDEGSGLVKTRTNSLMGTPTYMAPEQCKGAGRVDLRTDVYALGCVAYHMLCGRPPFLAEGLGEMILAHMQQPPPPVAELVGGVPADIEAIILRMLAKAPDDRFQTMAELVAMIDAVTRGEHASAPGLGRTAMLTDTAAAGAAAPTPTTLGASAGQVAGATEPPTARGGTGKIVAVGAGVAVAAGILIAGLMLAGGDDGEVASETAPADGGAEQTAPATVAVDAAPVAAPVTIDATPEPRTIRVEIRSDPDGADVFDHNGRRVGRTPYGNELPAKDGELVYTLSRSGYRDAEVSFSGQEGGVQNIDLERKRRRPPKPPKEDDDNPFGHR